MERSRSASYSGQRMPYLPTDREGKLLTPPSAIKQREVARAKETKEDYGASLFVILSNLDRLSSGGHDFSRAIGLELSKKDMFVSDHSVVRRAMKDLGEVLENTKSNSKLVVQERNGCSSTPVNKLDIASTVQCSYEVSLEGSGAAIPLCLPNDCVWNKRDRVCKKSKGVVRNALILQEQALKILQSITGPVCVISIVGPCRTGKSYILSRLIGGERERSHFNLGHKMDPETMGIWIWDTPFQHQLADGTNVTMILMDTEGIDAANATDRGDNQIFTLSVLLSSLLIYNSMGRPQRDDLQKMNFVANLSKSIQMQAGKKLQADEVTQFSEWAPKFMWLLRDVILEPTDKKGRPCHVKDFLLQKVLVEDKDEFEQDSDHQRIRRNLLSFFNAFDAETLPPPSTDKTVMNNIDNPLYREDISPHFLQQVEYVRRRILNNCSAKRGFSTGYVITGFQLAEMTKLFVEALNSPGGVPAIGSTWDRVLEVTYESAMKGAMQCYAEKMSSLYMPSESTDLLKHHGQAWGKALCVFREALNMDTDEACYEKYLKQLQEQIAQYGSSGECRNGMLADCIQKNYTASLKQCRDLMKKLKSQHLDSIMDNLSAQTDFDDIKCAVSTIGHEYSQHACGPAENEVLDAFMEDLHSQEEKVSKQLQQLKNYDSEVAKQMERVRQQELEKERQEREKMELEHQIHQSKLDHKAMLEHMKAKFERDQQRMMRESQAQLEQQEKRLQNISDARLARLREESENQKTNLQMRLNSMQRSQQNTLDAQKAQIQQLSTEVRNRVPPKAEKNDCILL